MQNIIFIIFFFLLISTEKTIASRACRTVPESSSDLKIFNTFRQAKIV